MASLHLFFDQNYPKVTRTNQLQNFFKFQNALKFSQILFWGFSSVHRTYLHMARGLGIIWWLAGTFTKSNFTRFQKSLDTPQCVELWNYFICWVFCRLVALQDDELENVLEENHTEAITTKCFNNDWIYNLTSGNTVVSQVFDGTNQLIIVRSVSFNEHRTNSWNIITRHTCAIQLWTLAFTCACTISNAKAIGSPFRFQHWPCVVVSLGSTLNAWQLSIGAKPSTRCGGPAWQKTCK